MNHPDPQKHLNISLGKSALRIVAGAALIGSHLFLAGFFLIVAEVLGIWEELV